MIRLLLGGSPCTHFSIAQKNNRETQPNSGIGWELFKNYLIAKEKFKPDYFLYENNVSAAQPIKDEIKKQLGVWDGTFLSPYSDVRYMEINSALVSAQNRERFYVHNCGEVGQPNRGILLKDVLISGLTDKDKAYCLKHQAGNARDYFKKHHTQVAFESIPIQTTTKGESYAIKAQYSQSAIANFVTNGGYQATGVAEPVRVGAMPRPNGELSTSQALRIYSVNGKATTINHGGGGGGAKTGLYAVSLELYNYATEFDSDGKPTKAYCYADGKIHTVYEVKDGKITIKSKKYPIKLPDGFYIIRKLTVTECRRLQTIPDWYKFDGKEIYHQECYTEKNKENDRKCKYVKSKDVINPSQAKKLDCAINTILGSLDTGLLNLLGNLSIKAKTVSSKVAKTNSKQIWVTASNTIKNGNEINPLTQVKNVLFAVNLLDMQGAMECVVNITTNGDCTETHYIGKNDNYNHMETKAQDIIKHRTEDGFIKWLQKKYLEGNSLTEKSYTISILTNWIIAKAIFMCAKETKNTWLYIDSWSELRQNLLSLELSSLRMESIKKISDTSAYRMLGNGWTVEVIKHILSHIPGITTEPIEVLSMYDGMSCGQIALKELGANVVRYYATEIDKYAIQTTQTNFPDTIQLGDAFQVRDENWKINSLKQNIIRRDQ